MKRAHNQFTLEFLTSSIAVFAMNRFFDRSGPLTSLCNPKTWIHTVPPHNKSQKSRSCCRSVLNVIVNLQLQPVSMCPNFLDGLRITHLVSPGPEAPFEGEAVGRPE